MSTLSIQCDLCQETTALPPERTTGFLFWESPGANHRHVADVRHAWENVGWCVVCGTADTGSRCWFCGGVQHFRDADGDLWHRDTDGYRLVWQTLDSWCTSVGAEPGEENEPWPFGYGSGDVVGDEPTLAPPRGWPLSPVADEADLICWYCVEGHAS